MSSAESIRKLESISCLARRAELAEHFVVCESPIAPETFLGRRKTIPG